MNPIRREDKLIGLATDLVRTSPADETEVLLAEGTYCLTRFSRNRIHQNVAYEDASAIVRVVVEKRIGVATASSLSLSALARAREMAVEIAKASEPLDDWPGLPEPREAGEVDAWDDATAGAEAELRADAVARIVEAARAVEGEAAGAMRTEESSMAVANSAGVAARASDTRAEVNTVVAKGTGEGYAEAVSTAVGDVDTAAVGKRAAAKADAGENPREIEPDRYDVVLEPAAVAAWLDYLAYMTMSGKDFDEGTSPLCGKLGERITGEAVTLRDDALNPRTLPMPIDFEGMPARPIALIENGVFRAVATNTYRAHRLGRDESTGHALPATSNYECFPMHLALEGGSRTERELIESTNRGLLVTQLHYNNIVDRMHTVLTGMTRNGTFLIENGKIVGPVKNLRYTENVLEALARTDGMSETPTLVRGATLAPSVRVREVQFSGATQF